MADEIRELEGLAGVVVREKLCAVLFPGFLKAHREITGHEVPASVLRIAADLERTGLCCTAGAVATLLRREAGRLKALCHAP